MLDAFVLNVRGVCHDFFLGIMIGNNAMATS